MRLKAPLFLTRPYYDELLHQSIHLDSLIFIPNQISESVFLSILIKLFFNFHVLSYLISYVLKEILFNRLLYDNNIIKIT